MADEKISIFTKADLNMEAYLRKVLLPYLGISAVLFIVVGLISRLFPVPTGIKVLLFMIPLILSSTRPFTHTSWRIPKDFNQLEDALLHHVLRGALDERDGPF
ncbi:hypothetical protein JCM16307_02440 [Thermococcus prieurii]